MRKRTLLVLVVVAVLLNIWALTAKCDLGCYDTKGVCRLPYCGDPARRCNVIVTPTPTPRPTVAPTPTPPIPVPTATPTPPLPPTATPGPVPTPPPDSTEDLVVVPRVYMKSIWKTWTPDGRLRRIGKVQIVEVCDDRSEGGGNCITHALIRQN